MTALNLRYLISDQYFLWSEHSKYNKNLISFVEISDQDLKRTDCSTKQLVTYRTCTASVGSCRSRFYF